MIHSPFLTSLLTDTREFLAAVRFARAELLWLLLVLVVLAAVNRYAAARRRRATTDIGRPATVAGLNTHPRPGYRWLELAYPLGWVTLVLGLAGPRWGKSDEPGVAFGRDLVVVVDQSRSMQADDMAPRDAKTRWQAARAGLRDLMTAVSARGGHRVAVIVFADRPKVVCPLTTDYGHVRAVIEELDGNPPRFEPRPGDSPPISGTRIGAALVAAVEAHDTRFPGFQDILLVSDGDDPGDDHEWDRGSKAARAAKIPIHVAGVGDPTDGGIILVTDAGGDPQPHLTKLQEDPLRRLATETGGEYLAARREVPRLGELFRTRIEPLPQRYVTDDQIPQPKERYAWFLAPALGLFVIGWLRGR